MNWKRIVIVALLLFVGVPMLYVLALPSFDTELDPGLEAILNPDPVPDDENLHVFVAGFTAPADADPIEFGRRALAPGGTLSPPSDGPWSRDQRELLRELCDPEKARCTDRAIPDGAEALTETYRVYLDRLREMSRFDRDFIQEVTLDTPILSRSPLILTHRLRLLGHQTLAARGQANRALLALVEEMDATRGVLAVQSTLIGKMSWANNLAESLHLYAQIAAGAAGSNDARELPRLAPEVVSIRRPVEYELRASVGSVLDPQSRKVLVLALGGAFGDIPGVSSRLMVPHRTANRIHEWFAHPLAQATMSAPELARQLLGPGSSIDRPSVSEWLFNPGVIFIERAWIGGFEDYALRLHSLSGLVTLVNASIALRREGVADGDIASWLDANRARYSSPFDESAIRYEPATNTLTFEVPGARERKSFLRFSRLPLGAYPAT